MNKRLMVGCVLLSLIASAQAQTPDISSRLLFQQALRSHRADVHVDAAGLVRVPVPDAVLAIAQSDLEDVLLVDSNSSSELPVSIVPASSDLRVFAEEAELALSDYRLEPRLETRVSRFRESFVVSLPRPECAGESNCAWPQNAVARLRFSTSNTVVHSTVRVLDVETQQVLGQGALFVLPDGRSNLALSFALGARSQLRIEVESLDRALESRVYGQVEAAYDAPLYSESSVVPVRTFDQNGARHFVFSAALASGAEIFLAGASQDFVFDARVEQSGSTVVRGRLADYAHDATPLHQGLVVPVSTAANREWSLVIDAFDLPGNDFGFRVRRRRPVLLFQAPQAGTLSLYFGSRSRDRSHRFERVIDFLEGSNGARALRFSTLPFTTIANVRAQETANAQLFARYQRAAQQIDPNAFAYEREIVVAPSTDGASRVPLGLYALSAMRHEGDVRVVDASSRQWPYVLLSQQGESSFETTFAAPIVGLGGTRYRSTLPARARLTRVTLALPDEVVRRPFRLRARTNADAEFYEIASGSALRALSGVDCSEAVRELELVVEDGDEAPLELRSLTVFYSTRALALVAPAGTYRVLAGSANTSAPHYDLSEAQSYLEDAQLPEVSGGAWRRNPDFAEPVDSKHAERRIVWVSLGFAVFALLLMVAFVTRQESKKSG